MPLSELSRVLWREREALEMLWFKLEEEHLLLGAGQCRWLGHASRETNAVLDRLGQLELARAVEVAGAAAALRLADDATLRQVADSAPSPWSGVLDRHVQALRRVADDVMAVAAANRELLALGLTEARGRLDRSKRPSVRLLLDAAGYQAALGANRRVLQPSLVDVLA